MYSDLKEMDSGAGIAAFHKSYEWGLPYVQGARHGNPWLRAYDKEWFRDIRTLIWR